MQQTPAQDDEMRAFLLVLRQGLLLIVRHIEKKYEIGDQKKKAA